MWPQLKSIMQFSNHIFKGLWKRHITNIGLMTCSLLMGQRATIAAIGKGLHTNTREKHAIKRVDRFLSNPRVNLELAKNNLAKWFIQGQKQLLIAVDWTKIGQLGVLCASIVYQGRSIPLYWKTSHYKGMRGKLSEVEDDFFQTLATIIPKSVNGIILMDKGYCRFSLLKMLTKLGFSYVVRAYEKNIIRKPGYDCPAGEIAKKNQYIDVPNCQLVPHNIRARFVSYWAPTQKAPLTLITDLKVPKREVVRMYNKRFQIELMFRDVKSQRFGLSLKCNKPSCPERLDKLVLICFFAHIIALLIGIEAVKQGFDKLHRANTVKDQPTHSQFTLGIFYIFRHRWRYSILSKNTAIIKRLLFGG